VAADVPQTRRPLAQTENVKWLTTTTKKTAALLIVLAGTAASTDSQYVYPHLKPAQTDNYKPVSSWKGNPLLIQLEIYPPDIVIGWDNFVGWPPPEPPFIQSRTVPLVVDFQDYTPYNYNRDLYLYRAKKTIDYGALSEFPLQRAQYPRNIEIKLAPAGDMTTQLRYRVPYFAPPELFPQKYVGTWQTVLYPQGTPPLPPAQTTPTWPPPSTITNLPVRGAWEIPGLNQSVWAIGSGAFLLSVNTASTGSQKATFKLKRIGTLLTNTGPVTIRDNGAGGAVVLVDGPHGYYYIFAAAAATTSEPIGSFYQITDPNFLGATHVAFIDGWWIFNQPNSQIFYTPTSTYSLAFNGTNFALNDSATDQLMGLYESKEELWLIGAKHTEIWYDAGGTYFAFQRLVSTMLQVGTSAKYSIARFSSDSDGLIWLGHTERGENVVVMTDGFSVRAVSQPPQNRAFASYSYVADAQGYTYQEDGHEFYVLTFPSVVTTLGLGATWVYDLQTDMWHERLSYEPYSATWNRHRSNCYLNFQDQRLVGDYENGSIYRMDRGTYTDNGWPLVAWRRTPHVWDGGARERVFMAMMQIEFSPGVGTSTGLGVDPQVILTQSKDGGTTWGQEIRRSLGKIGAYLTRVIFRRLGVTRNTVFDVKVYDPVKRDIVGATIKKAQD
jgi:hypothetical protein